MSRHGQPWTKRHRPVHVALRRSALNDSLKCSLECRYLPEYHNVRGQQITHCHKSKCASNGDAALAAKARVDQVAAVVSGDTKRRSGLTLEVLTEMVGPFPQHGPVDEPQHGDVSSRSERRKVELHQRCVVVDPRFAQKAILDVVQSA